MRVWLLTQLLAALSLGAGVGVGPTITALYSVGYHLQYQGLGDGYTFSRGGCAGAVSAGYTVPLAGVVVCSRRELLRYQVTIGILRGYICPARLLCVSSVSYNPLADTLTTNIKADTGYLANPAGNNGGGVLGLRGAGYAIP